MILRVFHALIYILVNGHKNAPFYTDNAAANEYRVTLYARARQRNERCNSVAVQNIRNRKRVLKREKLSIVFSITGAKADEKIQRGGYIYNTHARGKAAQ